MARTDLSALTIAELEELAGNLAAGVDEATVARRADRMTTAHLMSPLARANRAAFGERPVGWDRYGNA